MTSRSAMDDARKVTNIVALDLTDDLLYQGENVFGLPLDQVGDLRLHAIGAAFKRHFDGCTEYRRYAQTRGICPEQVRAVEQLDDIPLIPTSVFKRKELVTHPLEGAIRVCASSGTQGSRSAIVRDRRTLERFVGSVEQGSRLLGIDTNSDGHIFVLGPDTAEAGDLWFSYVLSIVDLLLPTSFHVRDGIFQGQEVLEALAGLDSGVRPVILGPPVLVRELADLAGNACGSIDLGACDGLVITAGGWKRAVGSAIGRDELTGLAIKSFGLGDEGQVRDCFNMVELNTVLFECALRVKHIPPWLRVTARDPGTLALLPSGAEGVLAFLDALPTSYPGFVLSDDLGVVRQSYSCGCGRTSDVLDIARRIETVEARGCALKMDRMVRR